MLMKSRWVLVVLAMAAIAGFNSCGSSSKTSISTTSFMWVATQGDQMVRSYTVSLTNGSISQTGNAVATGHQPTAMALTPDGKTLYIVNPGDSTVGVYAVKSDGSLTASGTPATVGQTPVALAVDRAGKFLFVANQGTLADNTSGTIFVFPIGSSGGLAMPSQFPTETASDTTGTGPTAVAVSPTNFSCTVSISGNPTAETCSSLYVANQFTNTITGYEYYVDSSNNFHLVAAVPNSPYPAGTNPSGLAFSRCAGISTAAPTAACPTADDDNLLVANAGSNNISIFSACIQPSATCGTPNGSLTEIPSSPVAAGVGPSTMLIDPAADFVYAVDRGSNQVSAYKYSPVTGALTSAGSASTGASAFSGGITANQSNTTTTFNWIYVTNNGASSLSAFHIGAAGGLTALAAGTIPIQGQPSAIFLK